MFLSKDELIELTERVTPSAQTRVLRTQGIEFTRTATGAVRVLRETVQIRLGACNQTGGRRKDWSNPNWDAM